MPPTESEQHAARMKALEVAHSILTGLRDHGYRVAIGNTTLLAAICYFAAAPPGYVPTSHW